MFIPPLMPSLHKTNKNKSHTCGSKSASLTCEILIFGLYTPVRLVWLRAMSSAFSSFEKNLAVMMLLGSKKNSAMPQMMVKPPQSKKMTPVSR